MRLTKDLCSNIRYTLKNYMKEKLLRNVTTKSPHEYFGVTEEQFSNTLEMLIKDKYKGHEQFLDQVLHLKGDGYSISINGSYYHVYSDFGVRFGFQDLAPKEAAEYYAYALKTDEEYREKKEIYDRFEECLNIALQSCTSVEGLYKRFPVLKEALDSCFNKINEDISNASS